MITACKACGAKTEDNFCSRSCKVIHFMHYQEALRNAYSEITRKFYP